MADQEKIRKQAKQIMDDFMEALSKAENIHEEFGARRETNTRAKAASKQDPDFRKRVFKNAPKVKDDCILMEKKTW